MDIILQEIKALIASGEITDIMSDSRKCKRGTLFVCETPEYVSNAVANGASAVICAGRLDINIACWQVDNPFDIASKIADILYPNSKKIIAITGTNGKSSVVHFCNYILQKLGKTCCTIGTIGVFEGSEKNQHLSFYGGGLTTPDNLSLRKIIAECDAEYVALEASSHGLVQGRLMNIAADIACFTNITQDHLDYHHTIEEYFAAKKLLFSDVLKSGGKSIIHQSVDVAGDIKYPNLNLEIMQGFMADNLECAIHAVALCGFDYDKVIAACAGITAPLGRMEKIATHNGADIYIDFAHTPDALENIIVELRKMVKNRLIIVFGCGGERDVDKRAKMGKTAHRLADVVVVTDDNPRGENASQIRSQIVNHCPKAMDIAPRNDAISTAVNMVEQGDILAIIGKGHEEYQIVGSKKIPHSDAQEILKHTR